MYQAQRDKLMYDFINKSSEVDKAKAIEKKHLMDEYLLARKTKGDSPELLKSYQNSLASIDIKYEKIHADVKMEYENQDRKIKGAQKGFKELELQQLAELRERNKFLKEEKDQQKSEQEDKRARDKKSILDKLRMAKEKSKEKRRD